MNHGTPFSAGRAPTFLLAAAFVSVLAACAAAERPEEAAEPPPGPKTHLVRLGVPNRGMAVFLPSAEIGSKESAAAYLAWARGTFPAWSGRMKGVWDAADAVELRILAEPPGQFAAFLREGDAVVDPSGRNVFVVAETPRKGSATVLVRMAGPFAPGEATPETCITNAWALPRKALFDRWRGKLEEGLRSDVLRDIDALERAGRFSASFHDDGAWKKEVGRFVAEESGMRARIVFMNESGGPIRLSVEGVTNDVAADKKRVLAPKGDDSRRRVAWSARSASDPSTADADWTWKSGEAVWTADGDDVVVRIGGPVGTLKENPSFLLSFDQLAGAKEIAATVRYDKGGEEPALAVESAPGGRRIRVAPGRKILSVQISSEGFHSKPFLPPGGSATLSRGAAPVSLEGEALRPIPKPWPEKLVVYVDRNGIRGRVWVRVSGFADGTLRRDELPEDASEAVFELGEALGEQSGRDTADLVVAVEPVDENSPMKTVSASARRGAALATLSVKLDPPSPKPTPQPVATIVPDDTSSFSPPSVLWPDKKRLSDAMVWLSKGSPSGKVTSLLQYATPLAAKQFPAKHDRAVRQLSDLQAFWREPGEVEKPEVETFRDLVAHFAVCDGSCGYHGRVPDPKMEALDFLGWKQEDQNKFCGDLLKGDEFKWPWDSPGVLSDSVVVWWTEVRRDATDKKNPSLGESRKEAIALWMGTSEDGKKLKAAYRHAEVCTGCDDCRMIHRKGFRKKGSFEERRRILFASLLRRETIQWGDIPQPTEKEIEDFMDQLDKWSGPETPKTVPQPKEKAK